MKLKNWTKASLILGIAALSAAPPGYAHSMDEHMHAGHDHAAHMAQPAEAPLPETVAIKLSSKPLSDQDGHSIRLKNDLIGDRIVVVTFVYTSCTTVCPVVSTIMSDLQNKLGSRLDKDVRLISLSVDPARDTPDKLKAYAELYDARPGWFWLTGSAGNVTDALMGFGAYTPNFENHPVIVLIGDGRTGKWSRHYGLSNSEHLLAQIDKYLAAREPSGDIRAVSLAAPRNGGS